jgi:type IV secretion system protein VirB11
LSVDGVYLSAYLQVLRPFLDAPGITDVWINRPGEVWLEHRDGGIERVAAPDLTPNMLDRLARQIAATSHQAFNRQQPLVSASLNDGTRVQIIGEPVVRAGPVFAIRRHGMSDRSLDELEQSGLFAHANSDRVPQADRDLAKLLAQGDHGGFLRAAVAARKTVVLSGGTASGKTTLMNALVKCVPATERLVTIEDAPELQMDHANVVAMVATRGDGGEGRVDVEDLLQAALRLRPDRILLGELRGTEAFSFLRAVNSGHPGSITTIHADSPQGALDQIALLALTAQTGVSWDAIRSYIRQVVDVVVQLRRIDGVRRVTEVAWLPHAIADAAHPGAQRDGATGT